VPDLTYVSPNLTAFGPTVEVQVRMPTELARRLLGQKKAVPPPVTLTSAIVDTGATWCVFTPEVFRALELSPFDEALVSTTSSANHLHDLYNVELDFSGYRLPNVSALESPHLSSCVFKALSGATC
jgi:hypothetical protein